MHAVYPFSTTEISPPVQVPSYDELISSTVKVAFGHSGTVGLTFSRGPQFGPSVVSVVEDNPLSVFPDPSKTTVRE